MLITFRFFAVFLVGFLFTVPISAQHLELVGELVLENMDTPTELLERAETTEGFPDVPAQVGGSDVWAYTAPDGSEYALMGDLTGVSIVAVPSMEVVAHVRGPATQDVFYHRDIKTYGDFAYVVAENLGPGEGLQVIDLRRLPLMAGEVSVLEGKDGRLISSHNLSIDEATGFAYVMSSNGSPIVIVDLSDPMRPEEVGEVTVPDVHDIMARNDTLWVAEGNNPTFSVWDVSDKANPSMLNQVTVPSSGYVHNIWPSEDGVHAVTTEETVDHTVKVWNLQDMEDAELVAEWLGSSNLAHNAQVSGDHVFLSHYASGVYVLDISDPENPQEVAHFDTFEENDAPAFFGNWGVSLPTPGGYLYTSNLEGKLTVLRWHPEDVDV